MTPPARCWRCCPAAGNGAAARPAERIAQFRQYIKLQSSLGTSSRGRASESTGEQGAWTDIAKKVRVGLPTLPDILENLEKPGLDPRDALPDADSAPGCAQAGRPSAEACSCRARCATSSTSARSSILASSRMGWCISPRLSDRFVHDPLTVVAVGQVVQVRVLKVDTQRGRVQLSMKGLKN